MVALLPVSAGAFLAAPGAGVGVLPFQPLPGREAGQRWLLHSRLAVVASHAGIWPEVVDEQVGSLFQTGDLHDLIEKLRPYLEEPSLILQKADWAQDRASKKHSIAFEAQEVLKVYDACQQ